MEIFKAAAQQVDTSVSIKSNHNTQTREVESVKIQKNLVDKNNEPDKLDKLSSGEMDKKLKDITTELNFQMQQLNTNIRFSYNAEESTMVVQVREADTGAVIRELPTKEALRIARYFKESIGLLFDKES
ncbi:FlaG family protein [Campylobacter pinnipediorum]|uniref:FlaG family protein n=1 Tax=Campylobacter pinnipediorum TaxID=1965231 RepID=UPI00099559D7|nr:FlaG family protein [Campylobacter pinnipediorum]AQW83088.1 flagellar protein FlaG [Campylobacter pinnipediorum subsp. pinnipediorum]AQW84655.1 flagellar protein FlaG [Campylobacter pinnipediorum subsp. pinnipediorum]